MYEEERWMNVPWTEDIIFPGHHRTIEINADSYNKWIRERCKVCPASALSDSNFEDWEKIQDYESMSRKMRNKISKKTFGLLIPPGNKTRGLIDVGKYKFGIRTFPYYESGSVTFLRMGIRRSRLPIYQSDYEYYSTGACMFTGPVHIPILYKGNSPWMSLTPMEVYTLREALRYARGHVLIAGLGMGWLTEKILEKDNVNKVTQIELDEDVISFFGKPIKEKYGDKIDFIHADIYDFLEQVDPKQFDSMIFDIWKDYGGASCDEDFQSIKNKYSWVWGWGDVEYEFEDDEFEDLHEEPDFDNDPITWYNEKSYEYWGF